jgi:small subunit ribosomal protein S20
MANIKSSKKRARQTPKRTAINRNRLTRIRTFVKTVEEAIAAGDKTAASAALRAAQPEMMRGTTCGVLVKGTVSRKLSRLSARIKALS